MVLNEAVQQYKAFMKGLKADFGQIEPEEAQTAAAMFENIRSRLWFFSRDNFARAIQAADPQLFALIKAKKPEAVDNTRPAHPTKQGSQI